jgi:enoyl-CoA hydratase/carnithine racemase
MANEDGAISVEVRDHILLIGLNRPEKYNSYTPVMAAQLIDALTRLDEDPELWVGVVFGHGKNFCAGLDLPKWVAGMEANDEGGRQASDVDPVALGRSCKKPIITAVQGITFTFGIELALAGDIVIAADNCRFAQLEPARGIQATGGATFRIPERAGWGNAMYHLLTADEFNAAEAYRIGLVQEVVVEGAELPRAIAIAERIALQAPLAVQATKASARRWYNEGVAACVADLDRSQAQLMASEDAAEGVQSFIERRGASFKGK